MLSGLDIAALYSVQKNPFTPKVSFSKTFVFYGASDLVSGFPESEGTGLGAVLTAAISPIVDRSTAAEIPYSLTSLLTCKISVWGVVAT